MCARARVCISSLVLSPPLTPFSSLSAPTPVWCVCERVYVPACLRVCVCLLACMLCIRQSTSCCKSSPEQTGSSPASTCCCALALCRHHICFPASVTRHIFCKSPRVHTLAPNRLCVLDHALDASCALVPKGLTVIALGVGHIGYVTVVLRAFARIRCDNLQAEALSRSRARPFQHQRSTAFPTCRSTL